MNLRRIALTTVAAAALFSVAASAEVATQTLPTAGIRGRVEIVRDDFGVAHVFAANAYDVFFGYGYAAAEDRMFQMDLVRRSVAGRLSEVLGERPMGRGTTVDHDRFVRVWGLYEQAGRVLPKLSAETRTACEGYAAGVNHYLATHKGKLLYLFEKLGYEPEPWTATDSAACWYQIAIKLGGAWRNAISRPRQPAGAAPRQPGSRYGAKFDEETDCHISEAEMKASDPAAYADLMKIKAAMPAPPAEPAPPTRPAVRPPLRTRTEAPDDSKLAELLAALDEIEAARPKMSHAWAVGAKRSATGHAILESDPQLAVQAPGVLYEIALCGGGYNCRGACIPGTPGFLVGRSEHMAWGATAAGGIDYNFFREQFRPDGSNEYLHEGKWLTARVRNEVIRVKGGEPVQLTIRHTIHGPVVNALMPPRMAEGPPVALAHVATMADTAAVEGLLQMARATGWDQWRLAAAHFLVPQAHLICVDKAGRVGYHLAASIPNGAAASSADLLDGPSGKFDWRPFEVAGVKAAEPTYGPFIPHRLLPHAFDIERGDIATANNTSVGAWYPLNIGFRGRDSGRSIRLRELLAAKDKLGVEDMMAIHADTESPMPRTMVRAFLAMMKEDPPTDPTLKQAADVLAGWDGRMTLDARTWPLISAVAARLHRYVNMMTLPELAERYGPGPIAAGNMAKQFTRLLAEGKTPTDPVARKAIVDLVAMCMRETASEFGGDPAQWRLARREGTHAAPYENGLLDLGTFDAAHDVTAQFSCTYIETIRSPLGNCYSILAEMGELDNTWSLLPPGISENPAGGHFDDQAADWKAARLHRAWMSRRAVEKTATARTILEPTGTD